MVRPFVLVRSQQIEVIRDIVYEYGNLMAAGHYDMHGHPPWRTNCDDAFLLGCRKLGDFLMNDNRYDDDVLALDYLLPNTARKWALPVWNGVWRHDMNKYLAHIVYKRAEKRISLGLPEWNHAKWVPQLVKEFNNAWWDFREAIVDVEFSEEFDRQITECKRKPGFASIVLQRH